MSFENEGIAVVWEEIKAASQKLDWMGDQKKNQKRVAREYLAHADCDDSRSKERLALPGYN